MKKLTKILIISLVILCIVVTCTLLWFFNSGLLMLRIPPSSVQHMYDCAPRDMFDQDLEELGLPENLLDHAWVSLDGRLVVILNEEQRQAWIKSPSMNLIGKVMYSDISPDYKQITLRCYHEFAMGVVKGSLPVVEKMLIMQLLTGTPTKDAKITYTVTDAKTGEIFYSAILPDERLEVDVPAYNFSKLVE